MATRALPRAQQLGRLPHFLHHQPLAIISHAIRATAGDEARLRAQPRAGNTFLLLFAVLLPAIAAFGILYRQALSVPYQDDYAVILEFAVNYDQSPALKTKLLHIATDQVNEYKLSFTHFITASDLELTHHLNFGFLTGLGNSFLLAIAVSSLENVCAG